ncbi:MAG: hypothetical protein ACTIMJ_03535 [Weissella hellenica]|uniref:hypothetical protein n=1 Tax=Weissella hellenica TaxID=46256 RepID=UPI003F9A9D53
MNNKEQFFNFFLGRELPVCGELIYSGFESLLNDPYLSIIDDDNELVFANNATAFNFLINTSVAFERLGKIIILFYLNETYPNIFTDDKFNKIFDDPSSKFTIKNILEDLPEQQRINTLMNSHKNSNITGFIQEKAPNLLNIDSSERKLFESLDNFYKNQRYGRFHPEQTNTFYEDSKTLNNLLKHNSTSQNIVENSLRKLGETIKHLSQKYYKVIKERSTKMNLYTWELSGDSSSMTVFLGENDSLIDDLLLQRFSKNEILYLLLYKEIKKTDPEIPDPLDIDIDDYFLQKFLNYNNNQYVISSVQNALAEFEVKHLEARENEIYQLILSHYKNTSN